MEKLKLEVLQLSQSDLKSSLLSQSDIKSKQQI